MWPCSCCSSLLGPSTWSRQLGMCPLAIAVGRRVVAAAHRGVPARRAAAHRVQHVRAVPARAGASSGSSGIGALPGALPASRRWAVGVRPTPSPGQHRLRGRHRRDLRAHGRAARRRTAVPPRRHPGAGPARRELRDRVPRPRPSTGARTSAGRRRALAAAVFAYAPKAEPEPVADAGRSWRIAAGRRPGRDGRALRSSRRHSPASRPDGRAARPAYPGATARSRRSSHARRGDRLSRPHPGRGRQARQGRPVADVHPEDLSALVLEATVARTGIDPALIDDVIWGCVSQVGEQSTQHRPQRAAGRRPAARPCPGSTIDRQCGSSQQAVHFAAASGGRRPVRRRRRRRRRVDVAGPDVLQRRCRRRALRTAAAGAVRRTGSCTQGISAEMIAEHWDLSRGRPRRTGRRLPRARGAGDQGWALRRTRSSRCRPRRPLRQPTRASGRGRRSRRSRGCDAVPGGRGGHRGQRLADLRRSAAAAAHDLQRRARELGLTPLARFHAVAMAGVDPIIMLTGPIPATAKVARSARGWRSATSARSRSTRPSPRSWGRGSPRPAPTRARSTPTAARSRWATRSARRAPG